MDTLVNIYLPKILLRAYRSHWKMFPFSLDPSQFSFVIFLQWRIMSCHTVSNDDMTQSHVSSCHGHSPSGSQPPHILSIHIVMPAEAENFIIISLLSCWVVLTVGPDCCWHWWTDVTVLLCLAVTPCHSLMLLCHMENVWCQLKETSLGIIHSESDE